MKAWKEYLAPSTVLTVVCIVVTLTLAGTYQITLPIIEAIAKANADAARSEVLPSGKGEYNLMDGKLLDGVIDVYTAENRTGFVITTKDKGFGGEIHVMVGIGTEGEILGVKVLEHTETPGLGTKAMTEAHLSQFLGQIKITSTKNEAGSMNIDAITGATISSNAIFRAIDKALLQYAELGGANHE